MARPPPSRTEGNDGNGQEHDAKRQGLEKADLSYSSNLSCVEEAYQASSRYPAYQAHRQPEKSGIGAAYGFASQYYGDGTKRRPGCSLF